MVYLLINMKIKAIFICIYIGILGYVQANNSSVDLTVLYTDVWEWRLKNNPEFASNIGDHRYDALLEDYSYGSFASAKDELERLHGRFRTIDRAGLSASSKVFMDVSRNQIQTWLDGYKWRNYGPMNPISFLDGIQTEICSRAGLIKYKKETNFRDFVTRINAYAKRVDEVIGRMQRAIDSKTTHHNVSMAKVPGQLDSIIKFKNNITGFAFFEPFRTKLSQLIKNETIKTEIRNAAKAAISGFISKIEKLKSFIVNTYMSNTRTELGVHVLPMGGDYYKACLKWQLSIDADPEKIHRDGRAEVSKVFKRIQKIVEGQNYNGTVQEFLEDLRKRPEYIIQDKEETLQRMRDILYKRIRPKMKQAFADIPEYPLEIKEMPYDGPKGIYKNGAPDGSRPGIFYANVLKPENNPTYKMTVLLLHETDPGHHLQDAYALTSPDIPDFMKSVDFSKYFAAPLHFPFFTAYSEGWGLYSEDLGQELGIYNSDFERLGKYSYEIFRAARMVVDTGIHYKGWSKEEAVQYMLDHTTFSRSSIEREVDRYATWPGQATSYTVGKLEILRMRTKAKARLGECFDIKEFHKLVLVNGAMPLSVLEQLMDNWIDEVKSSKPEGECTISGTSSTIQPTCVIVGLVIALGFFQL